MKWVGNFKAIFLFCSYCFPVHFLFIFTMVLVITPVYEWAEYWVLVYFFMHFAAKIPLVWRNVVCDQEKWLDTVIGRDIMYRLEFFSNGQWQGKCWGYCSALGCRMCAAALALCWGSHLCWAGEDAVTKHQHQLGEQLSLREWQSHLYLHLTYKKYLHNWKKPASQTGRESWDVLLGSYNSSLNAYSHLVGCEHLIHKNKVTMYFCFQKFVALTQTVHLISAKSDFCCLLSATTFQPQLFSATPT